MQRRIDVTVAACVKGMLIKIAAAQHRDFRAAELQQKIKVMSGKVLDFIDEQLIVVTGKPGTDIRQQPPGCQQVCEPPVIQSSGRILIMPGIRARYSGRRLVEAQATRCQLLLQERAKTETVRNSNQVITRIPSGM